MWYIVYDMSKNPVIPRDLDVSLFQKIFDTKNSQSWHFSRHDSDSHVSLCINFDLFWPKPFLIQVDTNWYIEKCPSRLEPQAVKRFQWKTPCITFSERKWYKQRKRLRCSHIKGFRDFTSYPSLKVYEYWHSDSFLVW